MKKIKIAIIIISLVFTTFNLQVYSDELKNEDLYSISACMIDGENDRILLEKKAREIRANASTTKIMTCIIALEYGNMDDIVTVSKYAASMPDVQLNICKDEKYILRDLIYSMMLESHNDSAVAIAEHIGGSVDGFAKLMNEKAKEIGCYDTFFITPNGLDATKTVNSKEMKHSTTAYDLAKIMAYCIKNEDFVKITTTRQYSFSSVEQDEKGNIREGNRSFTLSNKNALLDKMDGVISGKTGFTAEAGYCYVCAVNKNGRIFVVALLGCGWPNNKNYKWSDTKKIIEYGMENYEKKNIVNTKINLTPIKVDNGIQNDNKRKKILEDVYVDVYVKQEPIELLIKDEDKIECKCEIKEKLTAPVKANQIVGKIDYYINGNKVKTYPIMTKEEVSEMGYNYFLKEIVNIFILN